MALVANKNGGGGDRIEQPVIPAGVYPGRLVQLLDLGLQPQRAFQGKDKPPAQEIMLTYELVDTFMVDAAGKEREDKPRWISETLPLYGLFADKAKSTQRYKALDPQEIEGGDFTKFLGSPVNVTIVHNVSGGKTYANVANIAAMRPKDAEKCPELKNDTKMFDVDAPDMKVFGELPQWIQDKIVSNLKYAGSKLEALRGNVPAKQVAAPAPAPAVDPDNRPF
jgi:hypothetical protein